jgi:hypothetical protein
MLTTQKLMPRLRMRLCSEILAAHLDFDSQVPVPRFILRRLTGAGLGVHFTRIENTENTPEKLLKRRNVLRRDLKTTLLNTSGINAAKAERLLTAVEQTYISPRSKVPRLALWDSYLLLVRVYAAQKQPAKAVELAL